MCKELLLIICFAEALPRPITASPSGIYIRISCQKYAQPQNLKTLSEVCDQLDRGIIINRKWRLLPVEPPAKSSQGDCICGLRAGWCSVYGGDEFYLKKYNYYSK